jgi:hypothetical protein
MRPAIASIREDVLLLSSIPYISAFSRDGAALMTFGITISPSAFDCSSRRVDRRREAVIGLVGVVVLLESALRLLPMTVWVW